MMTYGLIGEHLGHSFSRDIHNRLDSYEYILREVSREDFADFMTRRQFKAINVTIPYKQEVIPFLDEISDTAQTIGAVNTIVNRDGKLYGYNTDFGGMKALLSHAGICLEGRKVLICGTGCTSKTAMAVAQHLGASAFYRASRSGRDGALTYDEVYEQHADTQVIINTTPCGMYPEAEGMPVDPKRFENLEGAIDAIYNPLRTAFVRAVQGMGIPAEGGLYMLVMQAVLAWEIFTGGKCAPEKADKIYNDLLASRTNIVLVGMPGSGKSTVGKLLAQSLGRPLIDTD
ncbi:MAG: shikimate dehydrogenase, partial [Clostridia bacterium]|nr:shikimate dehydrogenase [Clostridia bacterium]